MQGIIEISGATINWHNSGSLTGDNNNNFLKFKIYSNNIEDYRILNNYNIFFNNKNEIYKFNEKLECNLYYNKIYDDFVSILPMSLSSKTYATGLLSNITDKSIITSLTSYTYNVIPQAYLSEDEKDTFIDTYLVDNSTTKFLSTLTNRKLTFNSYSYLSFLHNNENENIYKIFYVLYFCKPITVEYTDATTQTANLFGYLGDFNLSGTTGTVVHNVVVGTKDLWDLRNTFKATNNKYYATNLFENENLERIEVRLINTAAQQITERYNIYLHKNYRDSILINYTNHLGGIDSRVFYISKVENKNEQYDTLNSNYKFGKKIFNTYKELSLYTDYYIDTEDDNILEFLNASAYWTVYKDKLYNAYIDRSKYEYNDNKHVRNLLLKVRLEKIENNNYLNHNLKIDDRLI